MATYLVYRANDGMILRAGSCNDGNETIQAGLGEISILNPTNATDETHYMQLGPPDVLTPKPTMGASIDKTSIKADGIDQAVITGIPVGAIFYAVGAIPTSVEDGQVEFKSENIGFAILRLEHTHHSGQEFRIGVGMYETGLPVETTVVLNAGWPVPLIREISVIYPTS